MSSRAIGTIEVHALRTVDACAGHERQAIKALQFSSDHTLTGVLGHDPIVWRESPSGRVSALCELETDGSFDPTLALFTQDQSRVLIGHPGSLRMYELESGALCWSLEIAWWEVFAFDAGSFVCVQYGKGVAASHARIDARTGALFEQVSIERIEGPPTATIERGAVRVMDPSVVVPVDLARPWLLAVPVIPAFSMDPNAHARLWPEKISNGELFLSVSHSGEILQGFAGLKGGVRWSPKRSGAALALLDRGRIIVGASSSISARLLLLDASNGRLLLEYAFETTQAEVVVCGAVSADGALVALGTTLGRAYVFSIERGARSLR